MPSSCAYVTVLLVAVIAALCFAVPAQAQGDNSNNPYVSELQLTLTNWTPGYGQARLWPQPGFQTTIEFLSKLGQAAGPSISPLVLDQNASCTRIFGTVVITVLSGNISKANASVVAKALTNLINQPSDAMLQVLLQADVMSANFTGSPVKVPKQYVAAQTDYKTLFLGLGSVGAFFMVFQFFYGLYHFRGFAFITASKDER